MVKRINVAVIRETQTSALVRTESGQEIWVTKKALKGSTITQAALNSGLAFKKKQEEDAAHIAAEREWADVLHFVGAPLKESEKAMGFSAVIDCVDTDRNLQTVIWFPKSQIRENHVPGWLIVAKIRETLGRLTNSGTLQLEFAGRVFWN